VERKKASQSSPKANKSKSIFARACTAQKNKYATGVFVFLHQNRLPRKRRDFGTEIKHIL
jgi:hypothetical protein